MEDKLEQTLRKQLSKELVGEVETVKYEVLKRKLFYKGDIDWLNDFFSNYDDAEDLYYKGICMNWDGEIFCLEIKDLLVYFNEYLEDNKEYKDDDCHYSFIEGFIKILSEYKDYSLYLS